MITPEKARQIALEYKKTGYTNKGEALRNVGYSERYSKALGLRLYDNVRVKEEIDRLQAKTEEKMEITEQLITDNFIKAAQISFKNNDMANYNRANENLGKHVGWYREDNLQKKEDAELKELQRQDIEEFKEYKRRQMLRVGA